MQMVSFVRKPKEKMFSLWCTLSRKFHWQLHRGMVSVQRSDVVSHSWEPVVRVAVAGDGIGVPAIVVTTAYYKRKFAPREKVRAVVA